MTLDSNCFEVVKEIDYFANVISYSFSDESDVRSNLDSYYLSFSILDLSMNLILLP